MSSLEDHITKIDLKTLAIASNLAYGTAIFKRKAVQIISLEKKKVEAWAGGLDGSVKEGGGSRRRVTLQLEGDDLHWHCTGNPKDHDIFCKHCVAVALTLQTPSQE
jgi:uncharacterized Zn finger protein